MDKVCPYMVESQTKCLGDICAAYKWKAIHGGSWYLEILSLERANETKREEEQKNPYAQVTIAEYMEPQFETRRNWLIFSKQVKIGEEMRWQVQVHNREPYCGMVPTHPDD